MFDPKWVREHPDLFDRGLKRRGLAPESKRLIGLDEQRRAVIAKLQALQERRNAASKEIGEAKKSKDDKRASALMAEVARIKEDFPKLEEEQRRAEAELDKALAEIPNAPAEDVPDGADAGANKERHRFGKTPEFAFKPKQHFDLGEALGLMDFELAAKLSGSRFVVLKGALARLERALGQFMLDIHTGEHGYQEVNPPLLVRDNIMIGTAQLPKFEEDQFEIHGELRRLQYRLELQTGRYDEAEKGGKLLSHINNMLGESMRVAKGHGADTSWVVPTFQELAAIFISKQDEFQKFVAEFNELRDGFLGLERTGIGRTFLIPTAEVPLTNLVRESIVEESTLPMRLAACTPCFRAEAGAAGKDTRGMLRQHQFTKVELVSITTPEQSAAEHERMLSCAEEVLKRLDLHYRVVTLSTGDMGFAANKTYDIEVWLPGENAFREISSCSNCGEFQARRMQARYRPKSGKGVHPVHTLNGSGVAVGRALIAVLENYQDDNGAIAVPDALQPYMGGRKKIEKAK